MRTIEPELFVELQQFHLLFRTFWELADYQFVDSSNQRVETAAIFFNSKSGIPINLVINESFWDKLNRTEKIFIICHEMLHVLLEHGRRFKDLKKLEYPPEIVNMAMDVAINEMLVWHYGFDKSELSEEFLKNSCWVDSIFENKGWKNKEFPPPKTKGTEFYLRELDFTVKVRYVLANGHNFDDYDESMEAILNSGDHSNELNDFYDKIEESLHELSENTSAHEADKAQEVQNKQRGISKGCVYKTIAKMPVRYKRKWETVVKKWASRQLEERDVFMDRWDRKDRRKMLLQKGEEIKLPSFLETPKMVLVKKKIDVFFFLDTSGSCIAYAERFFKAASTLDPKRFNVRLFCFDTQVYETSLKTREVFGGGGTSFDIIEDAIQSYIKERNMAYPKAVWLLTDGYGNAVHPQKPKNWFWFLTEGHSKQFIHKDSKSFDLKDYE